MRPHVDPVLPTECKWPDGMFRDIIVHWDSTIGKKDAQELFLIDAVLKIKKTAEGYQLEDTFRRLLLANPEFAKMIDELVAYGIENYEENYSESYKDTNFQLYQK